MLSPVGTVIWNDSVISVQKYKLKWNFYQFLFELSLKNIIFAVTMVIRHT